MGERVLDFCLHDTRLGIWQSDANDLSFRVEIFAGLTRLMRRIGWILKADDEVRRRYPILAKDHRIATRGPLTAAVQISGRSIEIRIWSTDWPSDNVHGHRYCFDILKRMPFLTRLHVRLLARKIEAWLAKRSVLTVKRGEGWDEARAPADRIAKSYAESWHSDKTLGRPICRYDYNSRSADGLRLEHDTTVWFADRHGRICRGRAFYHINNMWWVIAGGDLCNLSSREIHVVRPTDLRTRRRNEDQRRSRLEAELAKAIRAMAFERAATLRNILFGAEDICRAPHLLSAVAPNGSFLKAADSAAAQVVAHG